MNKAQKRTRLIKTYISQLNYLVGKSTYPESFDDSLKQIKHLMTSGHLPEQVKTHLLQIHEIHSLQNSIFYKQSDILAKFAPEPGAYIRECADSFKDVISDFAEMIEHIPLEHDNSSTDVNPKYLEFRAILVAMHQKSVVVQILIDTLSEVAESTLKFIEYK